MIVADTNLITYLTITGERTPLAERVWELDPKWIVPPLWRSEFLNVLAISVRVGALTRSQAIAAWWQACNLLIGREVETDGVEVLEIAVERHITAYDAQFALLAADLEVPLVTGDQEILQRCPDLAISIEEFGSG